MTSQSNVVSMFWHGLERVNKHDLDVGVVPQYLFKATQGADQFIEVTMDLARLNNYILKLGSSMEWDDSGDPSLEEAMDAEGITDEYERSYIVYSQDQYPFDMDHFVQVSSAANALVIMYFWFIKSLKDVCHWAEPSLYKEKAEKREFHRYELGTILDILDANTDGRVSRDIYKGRIKIVMEAVQKLRNDYAHGNWDELAKHIQQLRLVKIFEAISAFLGDLELVVNENYDDPLASTILI